MDRRKGKNTMNTQLALSEPQGIQINSLAEMREFAEIVVKSRLAPKGFDTPESVLVALQMGAELGLSPMSALQNIAVINGRPCLYGDALLAVVRASGQLEVFEETMERGKSGDDESFCAVCKVQRKGYTVTETRFTVADAKKAGLWGKTGPWSVYPKRMLQMRARSFALRDGFADHLKGMKAAEEIEDYQPEIRHAKVREVSQVVLPDAPEQVALTEEVAQ